MTRSVTGSNKLVPTPAWASYTKPVRSNNTTQPLQNNLQMYATEKNNVQE
jgi:hypothetical protein